MSRPLHSGQAPWWVTVTSSSGLGRAVVVRVPTDRIRASQLATNAAALELAREHGLAAPELLAADLPGGNAGVPATIETTVKGTTHWPVSAAPQLIRAAGAALASVHRVHLAPTRELPLRPRPIAVDDFAADRRTGQMVTTTLLNHADRLVCSSSPSPRPSVFVHGDVWAGNMAVSGNAVTALIDWKTAGVGDRGVDVSELRKQIALRYGLEAAALVSEGYTASSELQLEDLPYWDAVAALNTPTDIPEPFRQRRDRFLLSACAQL